MAWVLVMVFAAVAAGSFFWSVKLQKKVTRLELEVKDLRHVDNIGAACFLEKMVSLLGPIVKGGPNVGKLGFFDRVTMLSQLGLVGIEGSESFKVGQVAQLETHKKGEKIDIVSDNLSFYFTKEGDDRWVITRNR
jgi:hypothetical protein